MARADRGSGPRELAADLAAHLEHLRRFRGVHYASVGPGPSTDEVASAPSAPDPPVEPRETLQNVQKRVLREQAAQWTPDRKLAYLRDHNLGDCRRCRLSQGRRNLVFGVGNPQANIMFVGEAPGAEEDRRGEPFVGAAGQRLDQWIAAVGLRRDDVYIANVLKCRPPGNRDPQADEIETCSPFLHAQIRAIAPRVLVALGRFAGALLVGESAEVRMYQMRGRSHEYRAPPRSGVAELRIPVIVTYHPSYVLRSEKGRAAGPDNSAARKSENDAVLADLETAVKHVQVGSV